jgi:hypothetical protein
MAEEVDDTMLDKWKKMFRKEKELDPLADLILEKLRVGYLVDYDMKTWKVTEHSRYDFGEGYTAEEWELTSGGERCYLERSEDDEVEWGLSRKVPIGAVENNVRQHIVEHDDPPDKVVCKGDTYYLEESGSGYLLPEGGGEKRGFIYWDFLHEDGERFLAIEQWGETEFEASLGTEVEEYQFSNILPGGSE